MIRGIILAVFAVVLIGAGSCQVTRDPWLPVDQPDYDGWIDDPIPSTERAAGLFFTPELVGASFSFVPQFHIEGLPNPDHPDELWAKVEVWYDDGTDWEDYTEPLKAYLSGQTRFEDLPSHTYEKPGKYQPRVRVTFWDGEVLTSNNRIYGRTAKYPVYRILEVVPLEDLPIEGKRHARIEIPNYPVPAPFELVTHIGVEAGPEDGYGYLTCFKIVEIDYGDGSGWIDVSRIQRDHVLGIIQEDDLPVHT